MADKTYNIDIGGQNFEVPAWASEGTMLNVAAELEQIGSIDSKMLGILSQYTKNSKDIIAKIDKNVQDDARQSQVDASANRTLTSRTKSMGRAILDSTSFLGNADAPLTSLVGAAKEVGGPLKSLVQKFFGRGGATEAVGNAVNGAANATSRSAGFMDRHGKVISDAFFMWAGWNAGKLESFAKVQQQMIDNGAIMFESSAAFEQLRRDVNRSGVTYDAFAKTIAANGAAISAFGGTTSLGTRSFRDLFKTIKEAGDSVGDFGLSNTEILQQTGEFLEYQRLTGGLARGVVGLEDNLTESFKKLQIETAGLASITGLQRSQVLQAAIQIENVDYAAGLAKLQGNEKAAADEARKMFTLFEQVGGSSPISSLSAALARTLAYANDLQDIDVETQMAAMANDDLQALKLAFGDDIINSLENAIKQGDIASVQDVLFGLAKEDIEYFGTFTGSVTNPIFAKTTEIANSLKLIQDVFGKNISGDRYREAIEKAEKGLSEAGTSTQLLNDAAAAFLMVQNAVTLPMNLLADTLKVASQGIKSASDFITGANNRQADYNETFSSRQATQIPTSAEDIANVDPMYSVIPYPTGTGITEEYAKQAWEDAYGQTHNRDGSPKDPLGLGNNVAQPMFFGGPVSANNPYMVNDGVDMRQAELFVPAVDGRILSNRELQDVVNGDLTNDENSSTIKTSMIKEYQEIVEAKKQTLETMKNLRNVLKAKVRDEKLKAAIDASGA